MADLTGRVALVTGGGRGLGQATCVELAGRGARVAVAACKEEMAAETAEFDLFDVIPGQAGKGQQRSDVLIERRRTDHPGDPLAFEIGNGLDTDIAGCHHR